MSQSPEKFESLDVDHRYLQNFTMLGRLIGQGRSFSGRERNCCFLNLRNESFADASSTTGLDAIDDARNIATTDWDGDGDLDLWIGNRTAPRVRFYRNDFLGEHQFIAFKLQGVNSNRDAIGARVTIHFSSGKTTRVAAKSVRAGEGFLSQSSKWLHFNFTSDERIDRISIRWPGRTSEQILEEARPNQRYVVVEDRDPTILSSRANLKNMEPTPFQSPSVESSSRLVLTKRPPLPKIEGVASNQSLNGKPFLLVVWASWCQPCLDELREMARQTEIIRRAGIQIVALNADEMTDDITREITDDITSDGDSKSSAHAAYIKELGWQFLDFTASERTLQHLTHLRNSVVYREQPLSLPSSFLVDQERRVAAIYSGPAEVEQCLSDCKLLNASTREISEAAFPFAGRTASRLFATDLLAPGQAYLEAGFFADARQALDQLAVGNKFDTTSLSRSYHNLGVAEKRAGDLSSAIKAFRQSLALTPDRQSTATLLATTLIENGNAAEAKTILANLVQGDPKNPRQLATLAKCYELISEPKTAMELYEKSLRENPKDHRTRLQFAVLLQTEGMARDATEQYQQVMRDAPNSLDAANNLAWILATNSQLRNPTEALDIAKRTSGMNHELTPLQMTNVLDTLAAAQAANQQFDAAIDTAKKAIEFARIANNPELGMRISDRLQLYRSKQRFTE